MKFILFLFLYFGLASSIFPQSFTRFIIIDDSIRQPLPYATLRYSNKNTGYYANEHGEINIPVFNDDTLIISYVGYLQKKVFGVLLKKDTILLNPTPNNLAEIIVKKRKPVGNPLNVGYMNEKTAFKTGSMVAVEFAVMVQIPEKYQIYKINQIIIPLQKTTLINPIRIHVYEPSPNMEPGEEILKEDIVIKKVNNDTKYEIDVSKQNIVISSKIIFIAIEWIGNTENSNKIFGPYTRFTASLGEARTYTRTINDMSHKWIKFNPNSTPKTNPPNLIAGLSIQPLED